MSPQKSEILSHKLHVLPVRAAKLLFYNVLHYVTEGMNSGGFTFSVKNRSYLTIMSNYKMKRRVGLTCAATDMDMVKLIQDLRQSFAKPYDMINKSTRAWIYWTMILTLTRPV